MNGSTTEPLTCSVFVRYDKIMQTELDEKIDVLAKFKGGEITPLLFKSQNRVYKIDSINLRYEFIEGDVKFISYSVNSESNTFKITFNTKEMEWKLEEIFSN